LLIADLIAFSLAFFGGGLLGYVINVYVFNTDYDVIFSTDDITRRAVFFFLLIGLTISSLYRRGRYTRLYGMLDNFIQSTRMILIAIAIDALIQYTTKQSFSRLWLFGSWGLSAFFLPVSFWFTRHCLRRLGLWQQSIVLVGDKHERERVAKAL
ncbi:unnamed protein product, partial [Ectocarpus sp. 13 AM-2016]